MPRILAALFGCQPQNSNRSVALFGGRQPQNGVRSRPPQWKAGGCCSDDEEALLPSERLMAAEPIHSMEVPDASDDAGLRPRHRPRPIKETQDEKKIRRMLEKQNQAQGLMATQQEAKRIYTAKQQMLESESLAEFLEKVEILIEEDWLGNIDPLPGSMYFIATFGDLTKENVTCSLVGLKAVARFMGCIVIGTIQFVSGPIVFLSTIFAWGMQAGDKYQWDNWDPSDLDNSFSDWKHVKVKKLMGMLFLFCFILNGIFVLLDGKMVWFKIYNTLQYLERKTPNFDFSFFSSAALYSGAFINCWTVLWCSLASYVVVGASETPKDVLLDALGMLFLYNLDRIGSELGFVDADDWPGDRLGWIFQEMVKKNWDPELDTDRGTVAEGTMEGEMRECIKGCGRPVAEGLDAKGRPFDTCCRGCGTGGEHDEECDEKHRERRKQQREEHMEVKDVYEGGETQDWNCGGYFILAMYNVTVVLLLILALVIPVLTAGTPFNKIVPELISNE